MQSRSRGFTLMELMLVLVLAGIILAIGAPSFGEFRRSHRMAGIANDFLVAVQTARSEAIKRQTPVALCPSANPEAEEPTCSGTPAFTGWIAFVDPDNNCERDPAVEEEEIVQIGARIDAGNTAARWVGSVASGDCLSFAATGFTQTVAGHATASRMLFCDDRGNTPQPGTELSSARGVDISRTGRARITRDIEEIASWSIACPGEEADEEEAE